MGLLRRTEVGYAAGFAEREARPYGVLYHFDGLPRSFECNHAFITDQRVDPFAAVGDVARFYEERGLTPRIRGSLCAGELPRLRPALEAHGFAVLDDLHPRPACLVLSREPAVRPHPDLAVRRVTEMDDGVAGLIRDEGEFPWTVDLIRRRVLMEGDRFQLLVGFLGDLPVAMASLSVFDGLSRVDDVVTREWYRGRGFARAVLYALVEAHRRMPGNGLYLWVTDPVARRVYEAVGFVEQHLDSGPWMSAKVGDG